MSEEYKNPRRKWQTGETITLNTVHPVTGEPRTYVFEELNQEHGSRLFWRYILVIIKQWEKVKKLVSNTREQLKSLDGTEKSVDDIIRSLDGLDSIVNIMAQVLPELFPWDSIEELSKMLLADHTVEIGDTKYQSSVTGFSDVPGDPLELFIAIFFAMCVNWPKYLSPLLGTDQEDSTRDSGPAQKQSEAEKS